MPNTSIWKTTFSKTWRFSAWMDQPILQYQDVTLTPPTTWKPTQTHVLKVCEITPKQHVKTKMNSVDSIIVFLLLPAYQTFVTVWFFPFRMDYSRYQLFALKQKHHPLTLPIAAGFLEVAILCPPISSGWAEDARDPTLNHSFNG